MRVSAKLQIFIDFLQKPLDYTVTVYFKIGVETRGEIKDEIKFQN